MRIRRKLIFPSINFGVVSDHFSVITLCVASGGRAFCGTFLRIKAIFRHHLTECSGDLFPFEANDIKLPVFDSRAARFLALQLLSVGGSGSESRIHRAKRSSGVQAMRIQLNRLDSSVGNAIKWK